jgi:hypothetical protein
VNSVTCYPTFLRTPAPHGPLKRCKNSTRLHGATTQKTAICEYLVVTNELEKTCKVVSYFKEACCIIPAFSEGLREITMYVSDKRFLGFTTLFNYTVCIASNCRIMVMGMWKKQSWTEILFMHFPGDTEENHTHLLVSVLRVCVCVWGGSWVQFHLLPNKWVSN